VNNGYFRGGSLVNPKVSVGGSVLVIIGGLLMLLVGALVAYVVSSILGGFHVGGTTALSTVLVLGPVFGLIVIIVGVLALVAPDLNILWGILAIVISVLSLFSTAIGGFFLGFLLALIGGILIIVKKAPPPPAPMYQQPMAPSMGAPPPPS
jgi:Family of unknown function (DUF6114)